MTFIDYNGLWISSQTPTGDAGLALQNNFIYIADTINAGSFPALLATGDSATLFQLKKEDLDVVLVASTLEAYSGTGTGTSGAPRLYLGTLIPDGDDAAIAVGRDVQGTDLFSHAFRDESEFTSNAAASYTSYDAIATLKGTAAYGHSYGYQHRIFHDGSGKLGASRSFVSLPTFNGPVALHEGVYVANPAGAGTIDTFVAFSVDAAGLTRGTANYVLYSGNTNTPSYHGGIFQFGSTIIVASTVTSSNLKSDNDANSTYVGVGPARVSYYATSVGYNAGKVMTDGSTFTTNLGTAAGYSTTTGSNDTHIGSYAGYGNIDGDGNTVIGAHAGRYFADGATPLTDAENSIYIGFGSRGKDNSDDNSIVLGTSAIGRGANTTVIGTTATAATTLFGVINIIERTADPAKPAEGECIVWMSDGTGLGDDGDVMIASTAGGVTKYSILFDHSAGTTWS